jgi:hypothetical protein
MNREPWFQIRFATSIVLMLTVSVLLGLNFYPRRTPRPTPEFPEGYVDFYGWPNSLRRLTTRNLDWEWGAALTNLFFAVMIVAIVGMATEWIVRNRKS